MSRTYPPETIKLFYGYAHEDRKLANRLGKALTGLKRANYLETWSEGEILAGSQVDREIENHITNADILLLLISPDFLASDYCNNTLLQRAVQRHKEKLAIAVLVLLKPVAWDDADFSFLLHLPSTKGPVSKWERMDDAFHNIAQEIRAQLKKIWLLKGDTYFSTHKFDMALYAYDEAIHLDPNFGLAYISKGKVQRALGDHEGSKESFEQALKYDPANANIYCELGVTYHTAKNYGLALDFFNQALQRENLHAPAHIYKGLVLKEMGKLREAREVYDDYLKMQPGDAMVTPFQAMLSMGEPDNGDGLKKISSDAQSFVSSLSQISFAVTSGGVDPLIPFLESFSRIAEMFASVLRLTEMHVQERLKRLENTNHSLLVSTANIKNMDETVQVELDTFIRLEKVILERQIAQTTQIFYELKGIGSQSISGVGYITQRLMPLLQQLSSDLAREDYSLKGQADLLAGRLWLHYIQQTYASLSSRDIQTNENKISDAAPSSIPTKDSLQTRDSEIFIQSSLLPTEPAVQPLWPNTTEDFRVSQPQQLASMRSVQRSRPIERERGSLRKYIRKQFIIFWTGEPPTSDNH